MKEFINLSVQFFWLKKLYSGVLEVKLMWRPNYSVVNLVYAICKYLLDGNV